MIAGILYVIAACFCWGMVFVIPKFLTEFSALEIALGRYLFFGLVSLFILLFNQRYLFRKPYLSKWGKATWYAFLSTLVSYTCLVFCIRYANSAVTALIFGMSPLTITLAGNWYKKEYTFRGFVIPILLMLTGIILVNLNAFSLQDVALGPYLFGLFCGLAGLGSWTWFAIANFHFLEKNKEISSKDWVTMIGVATLFTVGLVIFCFIPFHPDITRYFVLTEELKRFLMGTLLLGTVCSWLAFYFWNRGNFYLPVSLAGQLTITEMIFGLLFIYLVEQRWPSPLEIGGILIMIGGVLTSFKTLKKIPQNLAEF